MPGVRVEHDSLGEVEVPQDSYYGAHTARALSNFPISGITIGSHPELVDALACVKQACASVNGRLGKISQDRVEAVIEACQEIRGGALHDQFVVDVIQGGAGTSSNMNANEVIANRALELTGRERGDYAYLHPIDHVNASQSTNDVYPTAAKLALHMAIDRLLEALTLLKDAFAAKAVEFASVVKIGRTQLQDAVPMTLGQEFGAYAVTLAEDIERLVEAQALLREINLGGTAIGTGITTDPRFGPAVCAQLSDLASLTMTTAPHLVEATADTGVFVQLSGVLKRVAVKLSKTCNDLRLLSSGPTAGLGEINLPAMQAGSSIMPGKVNPVIPEVVNQVAFQIIGNDVTISFAAEAGQLQLNAFEPIIVTSLLDSIRHLRQGCSLLATRCVPGITANVEHLDDVVRHSVSLVTALLPHLGYEVSSAIAAEALITKKPVADIVVDRGLLERDELAQILSPARLSGLARNP